MDPKSNLPQNQCACPERPWYHERHRRSPTSKLAACSFEFLHERAQLVGSDEDLIPPTKSDKTSGQNGGTNLSPALGGQSAARTIAVDGSGDVFVVGSSGATDFPVTTNAVMGCSSGVCGAGGNNGFLTEFSPDGSKVLYSTFIGGSGTVSSQTGVSYSGGVAQNMAIRSDNLVVVAGTTVDANFPVTANALHKTFTECVDYTNLGSYGVAQSNFVSAIDTTKAGGQGLAFSTFVCEEIGQLALDSGNNIYLGVNGASANNNAAATPGSFTPLNLANFPYGPGIEEINNDGSQLLKMMWLGVASGPPSSNPQTAPGVNAEVQSISLDAAGDVYMGGMVWVDNYGFPIVGSVQSTLGTATQCDGATWSGTSGCSGVFVVEMNPQLSAPLFATVYGPQGASSGGVIYETATAVDSSGSIYVAGSTPETQWPTTAGAQQTAFQSSVDGFLAKFTGVSPANGVLLSTDHLFFGRAAFGQNTTQTLTLVNDTSTAALQIGSAGGFAGTVNLSCTVAYTGSGTPTDPPTCALNPTQEQVSSGSSANVTLTVNATGASSARLLRPLGAGGILVALALIVFVPRRRWRGLALLLFLALAVSSALTACGGGGATSGTGSNPNTGTSTGSYTVTVTANSGSDSASTTIPLSVQ